MKEVTEDNTQIKYLKSFSELVSTQHEKNINASCWRRDLKGNFSEIIESFTLEDNIFNLTPKHLKDLKLSRSGEVARELLLSDFQLLQDYGAQPTLNIIKHYERDDLLPYFSTDVYSYHVDRSPVPTHTFLCTYHGASSDILPNNQALQKILIPEIREKLKQLYNGTEDGFNAFLKEHFFDLHYQAKEGATPINLGNGNLWKLAIDYPNNPVKPCIHRAPEENDGEYRLMLIC